MRHCTTGSGCKSLLTETSCRLVVHVTRVFSVSYTSGRMLLSLDTRVQDSAGREEEIRRSAIAAGQLGIDVIAIWGFDACESMSFLSCERPQMAWAAFLKAIAQLRAARKIPLNDGAGREDFHG